MAVAGSGALWGAGLFLVTLLGQHGHGLGQARGSRRGPFRFADPFQIFLAMRRGARGKKLGQPGLLQGLGNILRQERHGVARMSGLTLRDLTVTLEPAAVNTETALLMSE